MCDLAGTLFPRPPAFEGAVHFLLEETAGATGQAFFERFARGIARVVGARYGLVGEIQPGREGDAGRPDASDRPGLTVFVDRPVPEIVTRFVEKQRDPDIDEQS